MATLLAVLKLFPVILAAIQALESAIPLPTAGKAKLDLVLGMVTDVYSADQSIQKQLPSDPLIALITATISRVVATLNALGIFNKKAAA
jgi:hypothetical protein